MNGTHGTPLHLWRLMDAQLNGTISESEIQDLDSLLLGNEEAGRTFLEYARIHAELHLLAAARSATKYTLAPDGPQPGRRLSAALGHRSRRDRTGSAVSTAASGPAATLDISRLQLCYSCVSASAWRLACSFAAVRCCATNSQADRLRSRNLAITLSPRRCLLALPSPALLRSSRAWHIAAGRMPGNAINRVTALPPDKSWTLPRASWNSASTAPIVRGAE